MDKSFMTTDVWSLKC